MVAVPAVEIVVGQGVAEEEEDHDLRAQALPGAVEPAVVRGAEQGVVEVDVVARDLPAGDALARSGLKEQENRLEGGEVLGGGAGAGVLDGEALEGGAQAVDLGDVLARGGRDGGAAVGLVDDEAFLLRAGTAPGGSGRG